MKDFEEYTNIKLMYQDETNLDKSDDFYYAYYPSKKRNRIFLLRYINGVEELIKEFNEEQFSIYISNNKIKELNHDDVAMILNNRFKNAVINHYKYINNEEFVEQKSRFCCSFILITDDELDFMKTDLYKKYALAFNLKLGIYDLRYFDKKNNKYYLQKRMLSNQEDYIYHEFVGEFINKVAIEDNNSRIFDLLYSYYDYVYNLSEKLLNHKNMITKLVEHNGLKLGEIYRYISEEEQNIRLTSWYKNNQCYAEACLGIFKISYLDKEKIVLSKLDYNDLGMPFNFYKILTYDEFYKMCFEKLEENHRKI